MNGNSRLTTKKIVLVALLAALTTAGSALRITLPVSIGTTSFHLGNILCALSGILLGPWLGGLAAGLGSAIYDMFNPIYISECWITFLTKGAYGLAVGLVIRTGQRQWNYGKATLATTAGAITYAVLYLAKGFLYDGLLIEGLTAQAALIPLVGKLPATAFNAVIAILCAPPLAIAIRAALKKNHLALE
ncbi:MAG TPA: ECF transporter S component [Candidatus Faecousia intestinigallinarum]|nr:ECF transporter S component [Candidatus Faecousia intestinigallinarum]